MKKVLQGLIAAGALVAVSAAVASTSVVVTPADSHGWSAGDTQPGGQSAFVADSAAPAGGGALRLTTDSTPGAEAQFVHDTDVPLFQEAGRSYWTKQNAAPFPTGDASFQLSVFLNGDGLGATTLVFEPSKNGPVLPGAWQQWDVGAGKFWSSQTVGCPFGTVIGNPGGPPLYTLEDIAGMCLFAEVSRFGVDVSGAGFDVETDLVDFDSTAYDFESNVVPHTKDDCKNGGWRNVRRENGSAFKNQGDCIQYVNTGK